LDISYEGFCELYGHFLRLVIKTVKSGKVQGVGEEEKMGKAINYRLITERNFVGHVDRKGKVGILPHNAAGSHTRTKESSSL
jgi:hypothetical protein